MLTVDNCKEVFFGTIASLSEEGNQDIINLTAKLDEAIFSVWIKPAYSEGAVWQFGRTKLTFHHSNLLMDNKAVPSLPLTTALLMFHAFLKSSPVPVLLISYSSNTVSDALFVAIKKARLSHLFHGVIAGFTKLLPIWKKNYPQRKNNDFRLSVLSQEFLGKKYSMTPYDATHYLCILSKLAMKISSKCQFIENSEAWDAFAEAMEKSDDSLSHPGSEALLTVVSEEDLSKMARAGLSYSTLESIFLSKGSTVLGNFLVAKSTSQRPVLFQDFNTIVNIVRFFEQQFPYYNENEPSAVDDDVVMYEQSSPSDSIISSNTTTSNSE